MDALTLAAVRRELEETVLGGRVQVVLQPDEQSLALELFQAGQRHWLLLSIAPQAPRVHLLAEKARRGTPVDTPFLLLARKRLRGARLQEIIQPSWERLLYFAFAHPRHPNTVLVAEMMGRWSNLVLNNEQGDILASLRHFHRTPRTQRWVRPGQPYQPPPPQRGKRPMDLVQEADLARWIHQTPAGTPLWKTLVQHVGGLSPLAAREWVHRATGQALADVSHPNLSSQGLMQVLAWMRSLPQQGGWVPSLALDDQGQPVAFAPYELTHLRHWRPYPTISQAAQAYYAAILQADSYAGRRKQVQALLQKARQKLLARRASLGEQAVGEADVQRLRASGEWILAYTWKIQPGDTQLEVDTGEGILAIPLDPERSPSENAQVYFARYRKAKRAAARVPALLAQTDRDLAWLEQLESDLQLAENAAQLEEVREALLASGLISEPKHRKSRLPISSPLRITTPEGFEILIGRHALQNEQVTWKIARPHDFWLHAQGVPGSHVIIRTHGQDVPETVLLQAAAWAAWHSQARKDTHVPVIITRRQHVRKIPGGRPGQVQVKHYRTYTVHPQKPPQKSNQ